MEFYKTMKTPATTNDIKESPKCNTELKKKIHLEHKQFNSMFFRNAEIIYHLQTFKYFTFKHKNVCLFAYIWIYVHGFFFPQYSSTD